MPRGHNPRRLTASDIGQAYAAMDRVFDEMNRTVYNQQKGESPNGR